MKKTTQNACRALLLLVATVAAATVRDDCTDRGVSLCLAGLHGVPSP